MNFLAIAAPSFVIIVFGILLFAGLVIDAQIYNSAREGIEQATHMIVEICKAQVEG